MAAIRSYERSGIDTDAPQRNNTENLSPQFIMSFKTPVTYYHQKLNFVYVQEISALLCVKVSTLFSDSTRRFVT